MTVDQSKSAAPGKSAPGQKPGIEEDRARAELHGGNGAQPSGPTAAAAKPAKPAKSGDSWSETLSTIGIALLIALVIRSFLFQPFNIPSESMKPTLLVGDYLFVSKFSYGYSRHSLPFSLPLIPGRLLYSAPQRGDVAVFKTPRDNRTDFIKRVIGLPGDTIQMKAGVLHINGEPVKRQRAGTTETRDPRGFGHLAEATVYKETLPNGVTYDTYDLGMRENDNTAPFVVPEGHFFMMGDNRDNSTDSRVAVSQGGVGFVPSENFVGKAQVIFFSTDGSAARWQFWRWFSAARYDRFFDHIE